MCTLQCANDPKEGERTSAAPLDPYLSPLPKILSRFSQLIDSDSNKYSVHIPGSTADVPSSKSGISEVPSDYDAPAQTNDDDSLHSAVNTSGVHDGMLSDNEREGVHDVY